MKVDNKINNISEFITKEREKLGLGRTQFANLLGMPSTGERTIRGWENGEHVPSKKKLEDINALKSKIDNFLENAPFKYNGALEGDFKFIDLFAGIGGIRLPFQKLGGKCVFTSEWDKFAQKTYLANYGEMPNGDITQIEAKDIYPNEKFDLLLAGFPCQSFSQAGLGKGFDDTRGTMFFEIQRILAEKRPKAFLLENVKQLRGHDKGRTLETILSILRGEHEQQVSDDIPMSEEARNALSQKLNYSVDVKVLRAGDFGVPQNRERIFIVGFDRDYFGDDISFNDLFKWPVGSKELTRVGDILQSDKELTADFEEFNKDRFTISDRLWAGHQKRKEQHKTKGNGFGCTVNNRDDIYTNTISARYYKDGSEILINQDEISKNPRKLTPRECARLQGFPEEFIVDSVSQGQIYKQFGNSVCMKVIDAVAEEIVNTLKKFEKKT